MGSLQDSDLLTDTKIAIKSLVISSPLGISLTKLCRDFEDIEGKEVPYKELGFDTLTALLKSMTDMVRPIFDANQSVTLFPVVDDSTAHITDLVANQSTKRLRARSAKQTDDIAVDAADTGRRV
ncbi:unnamed protein product [Medioppia subpectinata]|uniref:HTH OST-type domain-containing protein n=1 Tax=Medioppia subpectinata TaxID=1979941 RepID=A0A7R9Q7J5_9ACAR|nr:unnamed protein product [Medioppia subpectinata]CAG2115906.1 unnamed protein product [Medioppia subpectinata]